MVLAKQTDVEVLSTCIKACNKWMLRLQLAEQDGNVEYMEYCASQLAAWSATVAVKAKFMQLEEVQADGVK